MFVWKFINGCCLSKVNNQNCDKTYLLISYDQDVVIVYHKSQAENIKSLGNK